MTFGALAMAAGLLLRGPLPIEMQVPAEPAIEGLLLEIRAPDVADPLLADFVVDRTISVPVPLFTVHLQHVTRSGARVSIDWKF